MAWSCAARLLLASGLVLVTGDLEADSVVPEQEALQAAQIPTRTGGC